jgi:magnesium and cobalt transporter
MEIVLLNGYSRIPVIGDSIDDVVGLVYAKDLMRAERDGKEDRPVAELLRPATFVPETKRLPELLREMQQRQFHMAIVVDEYGGVSGLVTIEDVLEEIVGEIDDEHDEEDPARKKLIQSQPDGGFLVNALTPIADFNARLGCEFADDEFDTIGGMVTSEFGHLPETGEETAIGGFLFRVTRADDRRVLQFAVRVHDA